MVKQDPINRLLDLIRPHRSGYILSILLAVLGVSSGMVPYFAVAQIVNLLLNGETAFSVYLLWCGIALATFVLKSVFHGLSTRCSHEATFAVLSELLLPGAPGEVLRHLLLPAEPGEHHPQD